MDLGALAMYCYEAGVLKRVQRTGWLVAGITQPESVAEHTFRTAILGYILASLEGANAEKTAIICLFHDMAEARIGDMHRVTKHYIESDTGEDQALREQVSRLPSAVADRILAFQQDYEQRLTPEGALARDADALECLLQACEYRAQGYRETEDWIKSSQVALRSSSARQLADACLQTEPGSWWRGLKLS